MVISQWKVPEIKTVKLSHLNFFLAALLAFFIPFSLHILPFIIGLWTLVFLISGNFRDNFNHHLSNRKQWTVFILLEVFFLLHIVGMLYTTNTSEGWFDVQVKISLFLLPVLIAGADKQFDKNLKYLLLVFILGLAASALACYILALVHSLHFIDGSVVFNIRPFPGSTDSYFTYQLFSVFVLPTYFATFLSFGIAILIYFLYNKITFRWLSGKGMILLIFFFSITIFLLSSRAGLITWFLVFTVFLLYLRFRRKIFTQWFAILYPVILIVALFAFSVINGARFQPVMHEIQDAEHVNDQTILGSVGLRIVIWKAAVKAIRSHRITGVGTGDVRETLYRETKIPGLDQAKMKNLNVHNQFLETYLALGLPGLLVLIGIFIIPALNNHGNGFLLLVLFLIIVLFNFIFECMFDRLSGVVFFSFFYSLLIFARDDPAFVGNRMEKDNQKIVR
ncbi:MAG: O-antigen ligase family protein [Chlorobi bacterium]|nr:O-antigen ligase family protein [Chlorobiota bacterium]